MHSAGKGVRTVTPHAKRRVGRARIRRTELLPVLLDSRCAQTGEAVTVDGVLPGQEFVHGQRIARAGFLERQEAASHRRNDFRLATDDPTFGPGSRKIGDGQRTSIRPDHVFDPRAIRLGHSTHSRRHSTRHSKYRTPLKNCLSGSKGKENEVLPQRPLAAVSVEAPVEDSLVRSPYRTTRFTRSSVKVCDPMARSGGSWVRSTPSTTPCTSVDTPTDRPSESFAVTAIV